MKIDVEALDSDGRQFMQEWFTDFRKALVAGGMPELEADEAVAEEMRETVNGECDCLEESPEDVADEELKSWSIALKP